jgi:hypothetical protein
MKTAGLLRTFFMAACLATAAIAQQPQQPQMVRVCGTVRHTHSYSGWIDRHYIRVSTDLIEIDAESIESTHTAPRTQPHTTHHKTGRSPPPPRR